MLAQCQKGKKLDNHFKKEVWQEIMVEFTKKTSKEEVKTVKQLKTRANNLRPLSNRIIALSFIYYILTMIIF